MSVTLAAWARWNTHMNQTLFYTFHYNCAPLFRRPLEDVKSQLAAEVDMYASEMGYSAEQAWHEVFIAIAKVCVDGSGCAHVVSSCSAPVAAGTVLVKATRHVFVCPWRVAEIVTLLTIRGGYLPCRISACNRSWGATAALS